MITSHLHATLPATGYVRQAQLIPAIIPFSSATLWRKVKAGTFPAPVKLSSRVTAWPVESIHAWMQARLQNQGAAK
ncbi:MAG: AlpA family phage regulatory protein [Pseudomonadota bacterium]